jgi:hypothetical protein
MSQPDFLALATQFGFRREGLATAFSGLVLEMSETSEFTLMREDAPTAPTGLMDPASLAYHADGELERLWHGPAGALLAFLHAEAEAPLPSGLQPFASPDLVEEIPCC